MDSNVDWRISINPLSSATERWAVFGPPPLLGDEKDSDYEELYARISEAVKPADILEEIWICDIADLTWEVLRLRRLKAVLEQISTGLNRYFPGCLDEGI